MRIGIAGAHGQIAQILGRKLADRGDEVVGLIRNPAQIEDLQALGVQPVVCDLEQVADAELDEVVSGLDAFVFAAGAGPGSGIERKNTVDHMASDKTVAACERQGVDRFVQISSMGAGAPTDGDDVFSHYLRAKAAAEATLRASSLDWTILRPGGLTNDPADDSVQIAASVPRGKIPRADVADIVIALLDRSDASDLIMEAVGGSQSVAAALDSAVTRAHE